MQRQRSATSRSPYSDDPGPQSERNAIVRLTINICIAEQIEQTWDPMCVRACVRLRQVLVRAARVPAAAPALRRLAAAAALRMAAALHADVFLPALPPQSVSLHEPTHTSTMFRSVVL